MNIKSGLLTCNVENYKINELINIKYLQLT